jgi:hypothetical protein
LPAENGTGASDRDAAAHLLRLSDLVLPLAIRVASDLGVADHLVKGPRPVEELAAATRAHAPSLRRLLRLLAAQHVFEEVEAGCFGLSPISELLRSDHPFSLRAVCTLAAPVVEGWAEADFSFRTGRAAFERAHGEDYWSYLASHPDVREQLDRMQDAATRLDLLTATRGYPWGDFETVVDVGGGSGAFLAGLLQRHPAMRGILVDLPAVVSNAACVLARAGVADRCAVVPGSFFDELPAGADCYVLKAILGGWDDEQASAILLRVREAMRATSRLVVLEPVLDPDGECTLGNVLHLNSLVLVGGPDRTSAEYAALLAGADLELTAVVWRPTLPIIEARAATRGSHASA